jgi:flagellar motor switch protein FliG
LIQDVGYPSVALALKEERTDVRAALLAKLPPATREIIEQELDVTTSDPVAAADAKARIVASGRKLLNEGRIHLPERA